MPFPRIIHQTWKNTTVPAKWAESEREWKRLHPTWEYRLWTDEMNRELIATEFNWFLPTYDSFAYPIQRVDAVRTFILWKYGGIYSDLDIVPLHGFDSVFRLHDDMEQIQVVLGCSGNSPSDNHPVTNALMWCKPYAAFWPLVWKEMQSRQTCHKFPTWWHRLLVKFPYFHTTFITGPPMLSEVLLPPRSAGLSRATRRRQNWEGEAEVAASRAATAARAQVTLWPMQLCAQNTFNRKLNRSLAHYQPWTKSLRGSSWHEWDGKMWILLYRTQCCVQDNVIPIVLLELATIIVFFILLLVLFGSMG